MFTLKIKTDNAAFENSPELEVARILSLVRIKICDYGHTSGNLQDSNGNTVGSFKLSNR